MLIEKDFKLTARELAGVCENSVYEKLPDLKEMIRLMESYARSN